MKGINSSGVRESNPENEAERSNKDYISKGIVIYLLFYTFLLIVLSFFTYYLRLSDEAVGGIFTDPLIRHLIFIGSAGGLGGIVYCMRGFYEHKAEGDFNPNYLFWYFFRPIISTITGIFVFFLFGANLLDVSGISQPVNTGDVMFLCSVAFLAGFGFTQFYGKIDDLANTLFQPSDKRKNSNLTWNNPDNITYGTRLSDTQLSANASVIGKYVYNPTKGYLLSAGTHRLHVDFLPNDIENYKTASKNVMINVLRATPIIKWNILEDVTTETQLSNIQLSAKAFDLSINAEITEGNFNYIKEDGMKVDIGTVLEAGKHTLTAVFTPIDITNYTTASMSNDINVKQNK